VIIRVNEASGVRNWMEWWMTRAYPKKMDSWQDCGILVERSDPITPHLSSPVVEIPEYGSESHCDICSVSCFLMPNIFSLFFFIYFKLGQYTCHARIVLYT